MTSRRSNVAGGRGEYRGGDSPTLLDLGTAFALLPFGPRGKSYNQNGWEGVGVRQIPPSRKSRPLTRAYRVALGPQDQVQTDERARLGLALSLSSPTRSVEHRFQTR